MLKEGLAVWTRVPGTPFTLPGMPYQKERLPGMTEWAPQPMVERVARGLKGGRDIEEIAGEEKQRDFYPSVGLGMGVGGVGGGLLSRLIGGEKVTVPFREIGRKGISGRTLSALSKLPTHAKVLPLLGLGAGALVGGKQWEEGAPKRQQQALDVSKGLLAERILQQSAINQAVQTAERQHSTPSYRPLLTGVPLVSANTPTPYVVASGNIGF